MRRVNPWSHQARKRYAEQYPNDIEHCLGKILCVLSKAVEADEGGKIARIDEMKEVLLNQEKSEEGISERWYNTWYSIYYEKYIRDSVEEILLNAILIIEDMTPLLCGDEECMVFYRKIQILHARTLAGCMPIFSRILTKEDVSLACRLSALKGEIGCLLYLLLLNNKEWFMEQYKLYQKYNKS